MISPDDMIINNNRAGYKISESEQTGGGVSVLSSLVVPAGLVLLQHTAKSGYIHQSNDGVIEDSLYNRLMLLNPYVQKKQTRRRINEKKRKKRNTHKR
jgi:hypothetical protein